MMNRKDMRQAPYGPYTVFEDGTVIKTSTGKEMRWSVANNRKVMKLTIDGVRRNQALARIVYAAFNDYNIKDRHLWVVPIDGDFNNVHIDNLELALPSEKLVGQNNSQAILTDAQVQEIRSLYRGKSTNQWDKYGSSQKDLANMYGVTQGMIQHIIAGHNHNPDKYKTK